jgi:hypothetical protein
MTNGLDSRLRGNDIIPLCLGEKTVLFAFIRVIRGQIGLFVLANKNFPLTSPYYIGCNSLFSCMKKRGLRLFWIDILFILFIYVK